MSDLNNSSSLSPQDRALLELADAFSRERKQNESRRRRRRWIRFFLVFLFFGFFFFSVAVQLADKEGLIASRKAVGEGTHIAGVVRIDGVIGQGGGEDTRRLIEAIRNAFASKQTNRVVLLINSPGGAPYTASRIIRAIDMIRKEHDKPLDAVFETIGASAAYMIASHADRIVADDYSVVGSIGAKMTAWDLHQAAERLNVRQLVFASGRLKNMLDPFSEPTAEGLEKAQELVHQVADYFAKDVDKQRQNKLKTPIGILATGEVWTGREALELGLIDGIGTLESLLKEVDAKMLVFRKPVPIAEQLLKGSSEQFARALNSLFQGGFQWQ